MKKIFINLFYLIVITLIILILILSSNGIETNKFNKLIIEKASNTKKINLKLDTIKFKINPKELSLFLETQNPKISYNDIFIPAKNIQVYIDFLSLLKSDPQIKKINLQLEKLDVTQLNKLTLMLKPSNFKSLINNNIKAGNLISEIEIFLTDNSKLENFIARGKVENLKIRLLNDFNFKKVSLDFFADKNDILIKNIVGNLEEIQISDGDIKLNLDDGLKIKSNFNSSFNIDKSFINKYEKLFEKYEYSKYIKTIKTSLNNNISIDFDKTYKVKNYDYKLTGNLSEAEIELSKQIKNNFIDEKIKNIFLSNFQISSNFGPKNKNFIGTGKYSINNLDYFDLNFKNDFNKDLAKLELEIDYGGSFLLEFINYKKNKNSIANFSLDIIKNKNEIKINNLNFKDKKDLIEINGLEFKENKFYSFEKLKVKTQNNDFSIQNGKKILVKGNKFDATNLPKFLNTKKSKDNFINISNEIEIDFKNILVPLSEELQNFKLIGEIKNGQFVKISSKGDFGGNNFLDISMKRDKISNKKYLEIYSDLTRPLLTEYSFFNGLSGGKLLFTSLIEKSKSNSKLKIEDFRVINAPGVIKLLSLADLGGLKDLVEAEGLSFDVLEIDMEEKNDFLKLNEILALGPSMSVLMEGYQDKSGLISLRGTLVPAKTLNKMIAKIPVIGNIVIPKEVGEGLFGISFKIKGPKGKTKITINPIKTLTPRFIQKIIEKNKETR